MEARVNGGPMVSFENADSGADRSTKTMTFRQMLTEKSRSRPELLEMEWEEAMRLVITDRRYGAVKTLSQRLEVFKSWQEERGWRRMSLLLPTRRGAAARLG